MKDCEETLVFRQRHDVLGILSERIAHKPEYREVPEHCAGRANKRQYEYINRWSKCRKHRYRDRRREKRCE